MEYQRELAFRFPLDRGEDVRAVQLALTAFQTNPPCGTADGIYGNATKLAVMDFQGKLGLSIDGVVGPKTWTELFSHTKDKKLSAPVLKSASDNLPKEGLPLTEAQARRAHEWITNNFSDPVQQAVRGTPVDTALVSAIVCKETAPVWLQWITRLAPSDILARCVFDASGDVQGKPRKAFPTNTAAFRAEYGDELTDKLIAEANEARRLRGYGDQPWVYKGYGIFQYDLQHIKEDPSFFKDKRWYSFEACLERFMREMKSKLKAAEGDLWDAVRRYNGSGPAAEQYKAHVKTMHGWLLG